MHGLRPSQRRRRLAETLPKCDTTKTNWPPGALDTCSMQTSSFLSYDYILSGASTLLRMCKSDECMSIARAMRATNPQECLTGLVTPAKLHAEFLDKLDATCKATNTRPGTDDNNSANPTPPTPTSPAATTTTSSAPKATPSTAPPVTTQPKKVTNKPSAPTADDGGSSSSPPSSDAPVNGMSSASPSAVALDGSRANAATTVPPSSPLGIPASSSATTSPGRPESTRPRTTAPSTSSTGTAQQTTLVTSSSGPSAASIALAVAGVLVVLIAAVALVIVRRRRQRRKSLHSTNPTTPQDDAEFETPASSYYTGDQTSSLETSSHRQRQLGRTDLGDVLKPLVTWQIDSNELTDVELLGTGGQGAVFLVKLNSSRLLVSKRLAPNQLTERKLQALVEEIRLVTTLQHPSIVAFVGVAWLTPYDLQALFEYMPNGDLRRHLDETKPEAGEPWTRRKLEMARSVAEGLAYVHSFNPPIVHRDLKARNILLDEAFKAKIGDFGVSRLQSDDGTMTTGVGTSRWLAPEVIHGGGAYTEQCDIYSFGVVLVEMDTHALPFASLEGSVSEIMLLHQVARGERRPPVSQTCDPRIAALVDKCLHQNTSQRPNALEVAYELRRMIKSA